MKKRKAKKGIPNLTDYIPEKKDKTKVLVQAKLAPDFHEKVKRKLDKDKITWQDLIVASLKRYLDERKAL